MRKYNKNTIVNRTFKDRGSSDCRQVLLEEKLYNHNYEYV